MGSILLTYLCDARVTLLTVPFDCSSSHVCWQIENSRTCLQPTRSINFEDIVIHYFYEHCVFKCNHYKAQDFTLTPVSSCGIWTRRKTSSSSAAVPFINKSTQELQTSAKAAHYPQMTKFLSQHGHTDYLTDVINCALYNCRSILKI